MERFHLKPGARGQASDLVVAALGNDDFDARSFITSAHDRHARRGRPDLFSRMLRQIIQRLGQ